MYLLGVILVISCFGATARGASRIIGGNDAPNHNYPYQVSLQNNGVHFCSGSILNERWILTAAHCTKRPVRSIEIMVGSNYLNEPGKIYRAKDVITHEKYVNVQQYDISLIRTTTKIAFNDFIKPIEIAKKDLTDFTLTAIFSGWGYTRVNENITPNNLKEIKVNLVTIKKCQRSYSHTITNRHVCTFTKNSEGLCFGDSGGPLVIDGVQIGVFSFLRAPCALGHPDVFTRVFSYVKWIKRSIKDYERSMIVYPIMKM